CARRDYYGSSPFVDW
nr:immunoglobulin heavy chain junction region [Mus musculus]MBK4187311.1 immunoglobulin heavy chain junction region [Mus musculus]